MARERSFSNEKLVQTARNDAARLSSMVLKFHMVTKKGKNQNVDVPNKLENSQNRFWS